MKLLPFSLAAAGLLVSEASADRISLIDDSLVTGSVTAIDDRERVLVESPNTAVPLYLRSEVLRFVDFDFTPPDFQTHQERLHLTNGDVLPGLITGMDAKTIEFQAWFAGDLRIPRSAVSSIDFGVAPQKLHFKGPGEPEGWIDNDEWKFRGQTLTSVGRGTIARPKVLPEHFILRFHLAWETNPSFRFYFCDDQLKTGGEADRYYFDINTGGMQLKRQARDEGQTWHSLYSSQRRPGEFHDRNVEIELRVDRSRRLLYIYIDGVMEGRFPDPIAHIPTGTGIMLESNSGGEVKNIIQSIEVYKWDAISQLHRSEGHDDPRQDAIITTDSERLPGDIQSMVEEDGERVLLLKSPHSDRLFHIPLRRTSVLYFRQGEAPTLPPSTFLIDLAGQGRIQLAELRLDDRQLSGRHALLDSVHLKRDALVRLQAIPEDEVDDDD